MFHLQPPSSSSPDLSVHHKRLCDELKGGAEALASVWTGG